MEHAGMLEEINGPEDIRCLEIEQLDILAGEIRQMILEVVSRNGGHLAPSLGAVELVLALHYVFDTPNDKVIWDVGHQTYAHKIITGRRDAFHTLRKMGGISGFPKRQESIFDVFGAGHSSTSISAAAGIADARCLHEDHFKVVAVIGDGSMASGMAFEALNWSGERKKDLIVILNDNEMSISPNVGAMSSYLNRVMTGQQITRLRAKIHDFLKTVPGVGEQVIKFARKAEESLKGFVVPGMLFEELGFKYVGPLEGHRLDHLIKNLQNVRAMDRPVLVHVITKKGKGYPFAEEDPARFHGIGPFDIATGEPVPAEHPRRSYTEVFGRTMVELARGNPAIVAITAAMTSGTGLDQFAREIPERFYDVGIAEQHGVTFAAGLATEGFVPVVAIYSTFLQRAYDQVLHDVCLQKLPVVFALDRGGLVGDDGPTHHGLFDYAYLRSMPNIVVMAPKDENELQHMLKTAVECGSPASIRYPRGGGVGVPLDEHPETIEIGKAQIVRKGTDVAILAIGSTVYPALEAAERLAEERVETAVVNSRFVKPLDRDLLCAIASSCKRVVTVEEHALMGGFGSAVLEVFEEEGLSGVAVKRLGIGDLFVEQGTQAELRRQQGIDVQGIMQAVRTMMAVAPR
ncbi:MAG: 1-deoxy-D-xylulose-5-phosphate synthase [Deltaproteobacteria bacterium]|nr:1-deoxy-D-xylulose-5-phosphate synthase [Deltaproteobacteria bacterium]